jgi:pyruvate dehydrogenase phosphatase
MLCNFDRLRNRAGSCALLAYLEGTQLYVACTGDSRAVLGRRRLDGSFYPLEMSVDQTTKNSKEYNRIMQGIQFLYNYNRTSR